MNLKYPYKEYAINGVQNRGLLSKSIPVIENKMECYQSVFNFPEEFKEYVEKNKGVKNYVGSSYIDWIPFDFDNEDVETALQEAREFVARLSGRFELPTKDIKIYFSGSKGFHILISSALLAITPSEDLPTRIKVFVETLIKSMDIDFGIDLKIYDKTRIFRIPNTVNIKSGLFKIPLTGDEFFNLSLDKIKELAKKEKHLPFTASWKQSINTTLLDVYNQENKEVPTSASLEQVQVEPQRYSKLCIHKMLGGIEKGNRDAVALRLATHFKKEGMTRDIAYQTLIAWNKKNKPPLDDKDIEIKIISAYTGNYDFGCNDSVLKSFCEEGCIIRKKSTKPTEEVKSEPENTEDFDKAKPEFIYSIEDLSIKYKDYVKTVEQSRIKLGIPTIDEAIRGIARGESAMFMGRTSVGKSIFTLNIVKHIAVTQHIPVLIFTLESPAEQLYERLAQMILSKTGREVEETYKNGSADSIKKMSDTLKEYVYIVDKSFLTTTNVLEYIKLTEEKCNKKIGCVIIDYIGRLAGGYGANNYEKVTKIGFALTNIAKETSVALIFLHHVSTKNRAEGEPVQLSDALDSGRLVDAPDFVFGLWRNVSKESSSNILNVALLKSKKGKLVTSLLEFNSEDTNLKEIIRKETIEPEKPKENEDKHVSQ